MGLVFIALAHSAADDDDVSNFECFREHLKAGISAFFLLYSRFFGLNWATANFIQHSKLSKKMSPRFTVLLKIEKSPYNCYSRVKNTLNNVNFIIFHKIGLF